LASKPTDLGLKTYRLSCIRRSLLGIYVSYKPIQTISLFIMTPNNYAKSNWKSAALSYETPETPRFIKFIDV